MLLYTILFGSIELFVDMLDDSIDFMDIVTSSKMSKSDSSLFKTLDSRMLRTSI